MCFDKIRLLVNTWKVLAQSKGGNEETNKEGDKTTIILI
jgi:hypothetical protein